MAGLFLLLGLCAVMAIASFFAGALPLSMSLSQPQLRLISSIGVGILVGTSLIVIIPEGIEAAASSPIGSHAHKVRSLARRSPWSFGVPERDIIEQVTAVMTGIAPRDNTPSQDRALHIIVPWGSTTSGVVKRADEPAKETPTDGGKDQTKHQGEEHKEDEHHVEIPAFEVGFSMILGFILMFLVDRLPKHASESLRSGPQPQHFSLDNLGGASIESASADEEEGFLGSLAPTPKHTRTLATTIGLVIHAAADGIAMGASSATSNTKLGFVIFIAIMLHKGPAAFGLTSVLLRQGLSKRAARGHLVVFSLAAPVGAISTWLLIKILGGDNLDGDTGTWWTGMLLLFSGGTFLYVAMHAMQEDSSSHNHEGPCGANGYPDATPTSQRKPKGPEIRDTLATVAGMLLPLLTQFGHHH
ncbi:hypothetical protein EsDP_00002123 [Epichloe bromicola]|uniref:Uncharacterized protein n=1 Tax=Epichloe bromicola TaxID=79588 RepID=A0ABQ0CJU5_9HYPO